MEREQNVPELATFTLLNPDFHARVDQTANESSGETNSNSENNAPEQ
ncbi:hypothetical protein GCM10009001_10660 [Virgibacillus siamensis]|uniref:Uncharacterized protein n=1 Tax=Virgibacillus siamensis TaxID=480071 RepID=A0ABP3QXY7_9BACI